MKITLDMSKDAYPTAKQVYLGRLSRSEGKLEINKNTGMSEGSAQAFITIFLAMMNGEEYKRAFNNSTNEYLLGKIKEDFGMEHFLGALAAAQKHINYYATLKKGNLSGYQEIVDRLRTKAKREIG